MGRRPARRVASVHERQASHPTLSAALAGVADGVRAGRTLSDGIRSHEDAFGPLASGLVQIGEAAGSLDVVLLRLADALERSAELRRRIVYALLYPVVVLAVAAAAVTFLLAVVVPMFAGLFADFDAQLPLPTRVLIGVSDALRQAAPAILLLTVGFGWAVSRWATTALGQRVLESVVLKLPVAGPLYRSFLTARFCRTLATLLGGGVPLTDALAVTAGADPSPRTSDAARALRARVVRGGTLGGLLSSNVDLFPPMVAQMVTVGEETARLDETLGHAAAHFERQVESATEALSSVIEPVLILVLGVVVGTILVAMYLPMFDIVTAVE